MSNDRYSCLAGINRDCRGNQQSTSMPYSKGSLRLCAFLFRRGWVSSYAILGTSFVRRKTLRVHYKFNSNKNAFSKLSIKSTPGRRVSWTYRKLLSMCRFNRKGSYYVLSTPFGILSSDEALVRRTGGELLAQILF
jgi:ribosomal protein S8